MTHPPAHPGQFAAMESVEEFPPFRRCCKRSSRAFAVLAPSSATGPSLVSRPARGCVTPPAGLACRPVWKGQHSSVEAAHKTSTLLVRLTLQFGFYPWPHREGPLSRQSCPSFGRVYPAQMRKRPSSLLSFHSQASQPLWLPVLRWRAPLAGNLWSKEKL